MIKYSTDAYANSQRTRQSSNACYVSICKGRLLLSKGCSNKLKWNQGTGVRLEYDDEKHILRIEQNILPTHYFKYTTSDNPINLYITDIYLFRYFGIEKCKGSYIVRFSKDGMEVYLDEPFIGRKRK